MADLNFDLDNFDLESIDIGSSSNNNKSKTKSISDLFANKNEKSISVTKSPSMDNLISSLEKETTGSDSDIFGLDMLVNKQKIRKSNSSSGDTEQKTPIISNTNNKNTSNMNTPSVNNGNRSSSLFSNLFGKTDKPINMGGSNMNTFSKSTSSSKIEDIDIDKDLENLGKDLNKGMDKIKSMSGPSFPNMNTSNTSNTFNTSNTQSTNNSNNSYVPGESINMSYEDIQKAKFDLLCKFERLRDKGIKIPKVFSMSSDYEEMKYEYERLVHQKKMNNSVKMQQKMLISLISGIEFLNGKFDPFDVVLDGWSASTSEGLDEYEDIFEELYEKYQGSSNMSPEVKLCLMVCGSGFMFHLQNSMLKSTMPSADQVFRNNPNLAKQFADAAKNEMGNPAFTGFMGNQKQNDNPPIYNPSQNNDDVPDLDSILKNL